MKMVRCALSSEANWTGCTNGKHGCHYGSGSFFRAIGIFADNHSSNYVLLSCTQKNANTTRFAYCLPDHVSERSSMPAIIPLIALMVFHITILLHLIYFILQNEGVVLAAIVLSAIVVIDIPSLAIILHDAIVDQNAGDS
jgi:hypothetical protein